MSEDEPEIITGFTTPPRRGHCDRCQIYIWDLVSCIGPEGELLGRICEDCAKEYLASGLDEL